MKKIIRFCGFFACVAAFYACQKQEIPDSPEHQEPNSICIPGETVPEELSVFSPVYVNLPTDFSETKALKVEAFQYSDYVGIGSDDYLCIAAVNGDEICFQKAICNYDDTSALEYFKYNINTNEVTAFDGTLPDYNATTGRSACLGDKLFSVYESFDERFHYVLDMQKNTVEILKREPLNRDTDSFYDTYPVSAEEYAEIWFDIGDVRTNHVRLCSQDGSKEILRKDADPDEVIYSYVANDYKIYEYAQINQLSEPYINVYDTEGNLLSSSYLAEVAAELEKSEESRVTAFDVFGDYVMISVYNSPNEKSFLYHQKLHSVMIIDECRYLSSSMSTDSETENHVLLSYVSIPDEPTSVNVYCLDKHGKITALAEGLDLLSEVATDGKTVVYFKDNILYRIPL